MNEKSAVGIGVTVIGRTVVSEQPLPAKGTISVLGPGTVRVACEAAMRFGWDQWLGSRGGFIGMTGFGASGPAEQLYEHFRITPAAIADEVLRLLTAER